jgi:hypothetical protein
MSAVHSRVPVLRRAPQVFALSLALSFVGWGCGELSEPTSSSPMSIDLNEVATLDALATLDDPRALQLPTIQLSENGADLYGVGGGKSNLGMESFDLSAHSGPRRDFGHYSVKVDDPFGQELVRYSVDIFCVHIHGLPEVSGEKRGVIKGVVDKVEPTLNLLGVTPGQIVMLGIKDGGSPSAGPVDDFFAPHTDPLPTFSCKDIVYILDENNVSQGNIRVKVN